jgi:hypothetical protein
MKKTILTIIIISTAISGINARFMEQVMLQTDQTTYIAGESIRFRVTTTDEQQRPVNFSKVVYVELNGPNGSEVQVMVPVLASAGQGQLDIPAEISSGWYQIIAYTRYMRNEPAESFSRTVVAIVNPATLLRSNISSKVKPSISSVLNTGNVLLRTDKQNYPPRSIGEISVRNLPENLISFSISVAASPITCDPYEAIEGNSIFQTKEKEKLIPEYEGHIITGKIIPIDESQKDMPENPQVFLSLAGEAPVIYHAKAGSNNLISFFTRIGTGGKELIIVNDNEDDARQFNIEIDSPFALLPPFKAPPLLIDSQSVELIRQRHIAQQTAAVFATEKKDTLQIAGLLPAFKPDKTYLLDEYTRFSTMEEVIVEFVAQVRFRRIEGKRKMAVNTKETAGYSLGNSLVLLDNVPVFNHELLLAFNPLQIEKIEVFTDKFVFGERYYEGIVAFSTYQKNLAGFKIDRNTSILSYQGLQAPVKTIPAISLQGSLPAGQPDFRHVLLWEAQQKTGGANTITIPFHCSDITGRFQVLLTGITNDGKYLRSTGYFNVK